MNPDFEEARGRTLDLLDATQRETRRQLSRLDPELEVHSDERRWRVRDVIGHLGVWNGEAARSLRAYIEGGEYHCVPSEAGYDAYNGPAAMERRGWSVAEVWDEYDRAHGQLRLAIQELPESKWDGRMLYPWNEGGTAQRLIEIMMNHESESHCAPILRARS